MRFSNRISHMDTSALRNVLALTARPDIISFAGGLPAPEAFPVEALRRAADKALSARGPAALQYSASLGLSSLREKLARRHRAQGISCTADDILMVSGSQQGLDLAGKVFLEPGDAVLCENPTYLAALTAFRSYECQPLPVETDDEGMVLEDLERKLAAHPEAKLMYIIPTFQNPTGKTWSLERRWGVLALAQRHGLPILEDNPYGDLRYEGQTVPTLKSMDTGGIVTYMGSFSKVLSPGLRLGWLIAPPELLEKYASAKECTDLQAGTLSQMVADAYLEDNDLDANIRRISALYKKRRDLMLSCLKEGLPAGASCTHPQGGLFLWVTLPERIDTTALMPVMTARKVAYLPGVSFFADRDVRCCLRMNYSNATEDRMVRGVETMCRIFRDALAKG